MHNIQKYLLPARLPDASTDGAFAVMCRQRETDYRMAAEFFMQGSPPRCNYFSPPMD